MFVGEPTVRNDLDLRGLKSATRTTTGVRIQDSALVASDPQPAVRAERFPPDKAIDLVDEAASRIRMEIDSKPTEIDEVDRHIMQLEIELAFAGRTTTTPDLSRAASSSSRRSRPSASCPTR